MGMESKNFSHARMKIMKFPVLIRACWFGMNYHFSRRISHLPVTTVQYTVLRTLFESYSLPLNQHKLSILITSNENNLSSIVKRLNELGYVKISENQSDKREKNITITKNCISVFRECRKEAELFQEKLIEQLKLEETKDLIQYLKTVNQTIPLD